MKNEVKTEFSIDYLLIKYTNNLYFERKGQNNKYK